MKDRYYKKNDGSHIYFSIKKVKQISWNVDMQ